LVIGSIGQTGVYECRCLERYSGPSKFEHDASSCTITEREKSITVDVWLSEKLIEGSVANRPHSINISQKRHCPRQHRFRFPEEHFAAVIIHREGNVASPGQCIGPAALITFEPDPVMADEHGGPRSFAVRSREITSHGQAIGMIDDFAHDVPSYVIWSVRFEPRPCPA